MTFNPCGRVVDFLQQTVTDVMHPFRDSSMEVRRRWYRVPEGTPTLGVPSVFMSLHMTPFPWIKQGAGEIYPSPIDYTPHRAIKGLTYKHVCGTAEDFLLGAVFDPDANVQYDQDWIPTCCGRIDFSTHGGVELGGACGDVFSGATATDGGVEVGGEVGDERGEVDATAGGVEVGGETGDVFDSGPGALGGVEVGGASGDQAELIDATAGGVEVGGVSGDQAELVDAALGGVEIGGARTGDVIATTDATAGGVEVGGASGDVIATTDATAGGVEVGGESGDDYTPPTSPGHTCATAITLTIGTGVTTTVTAGTDDWYKFPETNGTEYVVSVTKNSGSGTLTTTVGHGTCPTPTAIGSPITNTGFNDWIATTTDTVLIKVVSSSGTINYTISFSEP